MTYAVILSVTVHINLLQRTGHAHGLIVSTSGHTFSWYFHKWEVFCIYKRRLLLTFSLFHFRLQTELTIILSTDRPNGHGYRILLQQKIVEYPWINKRLYSWNNSIVWCLYCHLTDVYRDKLIYRCTWYGIGRSCYDTIFYINYMYTP